MTTVIVNTQEAKVTANVAENTIQASSTAINVTVTPLDFPSVSVQAAKDISLAVSAAAPGSITVERPPNTTVETLTPTVSANKILDLNRLDASNAQFNYENGKLIGIVRENYTKAFSYDENGVLQSATVTTNSGTITKTFSYNSDGLTSITVT